MDITNRVKHGLVKKGLAFELILTERMLKKTAELNSVSDKIQIFEKADLTYLKAISQKRC